MGYALNSSFDRIWNHNYGPSWDNSGILFHALLFLIIISSVHTSLLSSEHLYHLYARVVIYPVPYHYPAKPTSELHQPSQPFVFC
jgi:hypothetical protein